MDRAIVSETIGHRFNSYYRHHNSEKSLIAVSGFLIKNNRIYILNVVFSLFIINDYIYKDKELNINSKYDYKSY